MHYEVLIPAHNAVNDIQRCIASAIAQEVPPTRVLVHVDGGHDVAETVKLARDAGAGVVSWTRGNAGIGNVRNRLIEQANAEYVLYLDSDDVLLDQASTAWAQAIHHDDTLDVIAGGWIPIGQDDAVEATSRERRVHSAYDIWWRNPFTSSAALIRRRSLVLAGGFDEEARRLVDYDLWLRMAALHMKLASVDVPLVARHVSADTITGQVGPGVLREAELVARHSPETHASLALRVAMAWARGLVRSADYAGDADYPSLAEVGRAGGVRLPDGRVDHVLRHVVLATSKGKRRLLRRPPEHGRVHSP